MRIKNVLDYKLVTKLFGFSRQSWNNWKKEQAQEGTRPIISLLEKYFSEYDLQEFLETQKITKLELVRDFEMILLGSKIDYLKFISENLILNFKYDLFSDLYYQFLIYLDEMQRSEDLEIYKTWTVGDTIPGFFIKHNIAADKEDEIYKLQYKFGMVNDFDQNMSNFIRLSLSRDMLLLVTNNIGSNIEMSEAYRKSAVSHALFFNIYKSYPELEYKEKMKLLLEFIVPGSKEEDADIIFEKNWKHLEVDINEFIEKIKRKGD